MKCAYRALAPALLAAATLFLLIQPATGQDDEAADGLTARVEVKGRYYRAGEPVEVRVVVENTTEAPIPNPEGLSFIAHLELSAGEADGKKAATVPAFDATTQPKVFAPGAGYLRVVDLASYFPDLNKPGTYSLKFKAGDVESDPVEVMVAHPYDPDLDYSATLKTDFGDITFDLLESVAPDHVRNFVDLARQDFYDGTFFHIIAKGEVVMGGDKAGDGSGGVAYFLAPELSTLPHERGTLSSVRTQGPDNGAQFFIDLRRKPEFDGNFTIFGSITSGEATLQKLESVPTTGNASQPFFKPLDNVVLNDVVITGSPKEGPAGEGAESGEEGS